MEPIPGFYTLVTVFAILGGALRVIVVLGRSQPQKAARMLPRCQGLSWLLGAGSLAGALVFGVQGRIDACVFLGTMALLFTVAAASARGLERRFRAAN